MNTWEHLKQSRVVLEALEVIQRMADPASGVAFMVRRGAARGNEDVEDEHIYRPWVTIEASNYEEVLPHLLAEAHRLVEFWESATRRDIETATRILNDVKI